MTSKPSNGGNSRNEAAIYIATLSGELASIAKRNGLDTLGYLLDMATLEAEQVARQNGGQGHTEQGH